MTSSSTLDSTGVLPLAERVAQLEERTKPKHKSVVDHVKEWGGVATVLIAILYTFPTGVWQQYFLPDQKAAEDLRSMIEQTTMMLADSIKAVSSAKDEQTAVQLNRSYTTRAYALMSRHTAALEKYAHNLTPAELMIVGMNYGQVNMPALSLRFLDQAVQASRTTGADGKVRLTDPMTYFTAARNKATLLFSPGPVQDLKAARALFRDAVRDAANSSSTMEVFALLDLKSNWAWMEMVFGDWACGKSLLDAAQAQYASGGLSVIDGGKMRSVFEFAAQVPRKEGQPSAGCQL